MNKGHMSCGSLWWHRNGKQMERPRVLRQNKYSNKGAPTNPNPPNAIARGNCNNLLDCVTAEITTVTSYQHCAPADFGLRQTVKDSLQMYRATALVGQELRIHEQKICFRGLASGSWVQRRNKHTQLHANTTCLLGRSSTDTPAA